MSNYRDDMNDTLRLVDAFLSKQRSRAEDTLRMIDEMGIALFMVFVFVRVEMSVVVV